VSEAPVVAGIFSKYSWIPNSTQYYDDLQLYNTLLQSLARVSYESVPLDPDGGFPSPDPIFCFFPIANSCLHSLSQRPARTNQPR